MTAETPEENRAEEENNAGVSEEAAPDEEETEAPETTSDEPAPEPGESILTAQNASYLVTVICGPEARVPQGASLRVEEIPPEGREYEDHLEETREARRIFPSAGARLPPLISCWRWGAEGCTSAIRTATIS